MARRLINLEINEISLVDKAANKRRFIYKRAGTPARSIKKDEDNPQDSGADTAVQEQQEQMTDKQQAEVMEVITQAQVKIEGLIKDGVMDAAEELQAKVTSLIESIKPMEAKTDA